MVRRDPDDLVTALSKHLKAGATSAIRFTFKRGALWQPSFAKAHSRRAKVAIRQQLKSEASNIEDDSQWPLLVRFRENQKDGKNRLNCQTKVGRGGSFIESLLGVFRVNFFKKKGEV